MECLAVLINGEPTQQLDAGDRGLQYGDGLFETIAVRQGKPRLWDLHMARLHCGCEALGLPLIDPALLAREAQSLCSGSSEAVLKIILTRGAGGRGYRMPALVQPTRILSLHDFPAYPDGYSENGIIVRLCRLRLARQPALAGIKHLNRLEQVLARQEWQQPDIVEGILRDTRDHVIEGVMSNLFSVYSGELFTPDLTHCGVAGVMREHVMALAEAAGLVVNVRQLTEQDLFDADEVFMTNSLIGIWPVSQIEDSKLKVGPITRQLQQALSEYA